MAAARSNASAGRGAVTKFCSPRRGEECDDGADNEDGVYGKCTKSCLFGPHCGDGVVQSDEQCDNGINEDSYRAQQ